MGYREYVDVVDSEVKKALGVSVGDIVTGSELRQCFEDGVSAPERIAEVLIEYAVESLGLEKIPTE